MENNVSREVFRKAFMEKVAQTQAQPTSWWNTPIAPDWLPGSSWTDPSTLSWLIPGGGAAAKLGWKFKKPLWEATKWTGGLFTSPASRVMGKKFNENLWSHRLGDKVAGGAMMTLPFLPWGSWVGDDAQNEQFRNMGLQQGMALQNQLNKGFWNTPVAGLGKTPGIGQYLTPQNIGIGLAGAAMFKMMRNQNKINKRLSRLSNRGYAGGY